MKRGEAYDVACATNRLRFLARADARYCLAAAINEHAA